MAINSTVLVGRLTKDVELRTTTSGKEVVSFTVAVDGGSKDAQTLFMNCTAFGNQAKFLESFCKKGYLVGVEGRLQQRSYDRKDGTKATVIELLVNNIQNLQPKANDGESNSNQGFSTEDTNSNDDLSYSDDDLPF